MWGSRSRVNRGRLGLSLWSRRGREGDTKVTVVLSDPPAAAISSIFFRSSLLGYRGS